MASPGAKVAVQGGAGLLAERQRRFVAVLEALAGAGGQEPAQAVVGDHRHRLVERSQNLKVELARQRRP